MDSVKEAELREKHPHLFWTNRLNKKGIDEVDQALKDIEWRRRNKFPTIIVVDGHSGQGKTTFAVEVCDALNGKPIVFKEALFMGYKAFALGLDEAKDKGYKSVIYSEAGDFDKSSYMSQVNKLINRVFDTFRSTDIVVILDLPSFFRLPDSLYEKGLARVLFHVHNRGETGKFAAYDMYTQATMRDWAKKKGIGYRMKVYEYLESNFDGHFLDLSPERSDELTAYCNKFKKGIRKDTAMNLGGMRDVPSIAAELGAGEERLRKALRASDIVPTLVSGRKNYYDETATNRIKIQWRSMEHRKRKTKD